MPTRTTNTTLRQHHLLFGKREFIIRNKKRLVIREHSLFNRHETIIPLKILQPEPTHSSSFSIKWLFNSLVMLALGILLSYWAESLTLEALYIPAMIILIASLIFAYRFFLYTTRLTVFRHAINNEAYLFLWRDRPNRQRFEGFINTLSQLIRENQQPID